uniref:Uncharacterized protein n=1 Tax=Timema poppense TaxID=170557 RepID=A0A7R9DKI0_TIMPO|nr:unnamed protein product [Timema poppensis]
MWEGDKGDIFFLSSVFYSRSSLTHFNTSPQIINAETIRLIYGDFLLVRVAHREVGNVLFAVDVGARGQGHTTQDTSLKRNFTLLSKIELSGYWTAHRDWVLG